MMDPSSGLLWSPWFRVICDTWLWKWWANLEETLTTDKHVDGGLGSVTQFSRCQLFSEPSCFPDPHPVSLNELHSTARGFSHPRMRSAFPLSVCSSLTSVKKITYFDPPMHHEGIYRTSRVGEAPMEKQGAFVIVNADSVVAFALASVLRLQRDSFANLGPRCVRQAQDAF